MNTSDYEQFVTTRWGGVAITEPDLRNLFIMSTGLPGESGEVCEKLKKFVRDGVLDTIALEKELGDVLFYLTAITLRFGLSLEQVMISNKEKIDGRLARGTFHGSGDDR